MKKRLTTFFMFAALLLAPFALVGCGEDIQVPDNTENEAIENPIDGAATIFTGSKTALDGDGTRTSMDANRKFYWEAGDYIWVDTLKNGTFTGKSHSIELSNPTQAPSATFYYRQIILTEPRYNLTYTGNNSSSGTEVTIAAAQEQEGWNNAAHLGKSGDCGFATTEDRDANGKYKFVLKHQAAYLVFQPFKSANISDNWKLTGIEIISDNAIAGTYDFGMSGIVTSSARSTANSIKLTCKATQSSDFTISQTTPSADKSCYVVIQPGTHKLTIKYTVKPTNATMVNDVAGATFSIVKTFDTRNYKVNGVSVIKHDLTPVSHSTNLYYMWDAAVGEYYWKGVTNPPTFYSGYSTGYATTASDSRWYNNVNTNVIQAAPGYRSCANLPNVNAGSWYVMNGDPRWDSESDAWCLDADYTHIYTCGAWFLKWEYITGTGKPNSGNLLDDFKNCSLSAPDINGIQRNGHITGMSQDIYINASSNYKTKGRPAPNEIDKYFFYPAMGHIWKGKFEFDNIIHGCPFLSSPVPGGNTVWVYGIYFDKNYVIITNDGSREFGRTVTPNWFQ